VSNKSRNTNYDILDKILADAQIPARQAGQQWVPDPNHPDGGYMVSSKEEFDRLIESTDKIEKYLRS
jgi:hypothetical protein